MKRAIGYPFLTATAIALLLAALLSPAAHAQDLSGRWNWVSTFGGWGGDTWTPSSEGYSMSLLLATDSVADSLRYWSYLADSGLDSGVCAYERDTVNEYYSLATWAVLVTALGPEPHAGTADRLSMLGDTAIVLWQVGVADGYYHTYRRVSSAVGGGRPGESRGNARGTRGGADTYDLLGRSRRILDAPVGALFVRSSGGGRLLVHLPGSAMRQFGGDH